MVIRMRERNNPKKVLRSLTLITQFGINMLVPIFLCSFVGIFIDRKLNTSFCMILLFFVGAIAGFRNIYILSRQIYEDKDRRKRSDKNNTDNK
ncbi:MAG: AtpZ/AtpI family protein [Lachnospiraceae bacterium]|nr:AtpZ/AtpI family protein [Lachnospiraceae bacterium]